MRIKWPLLVTVLSACIVYVAYPYVTLYRLGSAIHSADAATLQSLVDWPAVREGIKEDACDLAATDDPPAKNGSELPAFGASFVRGIASSTIDQAVTPQALLADTAPLPVKSSPTAGIHIGWAFFTSPTTFMVSLRPRGQTESTKLEMVLRDGEWRVQRVWLPPELLAPGSRT